MLTLTLPTRSWAHAFPASMKLAGLLIVSTLLFPVDDLPIMLSALVFSIGLTASLGMVGLRRTARMSKPLAFMVVLLMGYHVYMGNIETA